MMPLALLISEYWIARQITKAAKEKLRAQFKQLNPATGEHDSGRNRLGTADRPGQVSF